MSHRLFLNKLTGSVRLGQLLTRQNPVNANDLAYFKVRSQ